MESKDVGIVGRFAPSPSGRMHLGNVMTALLAWCSARSQNGRILLRMEDLDTERCNAENAKKLREDLLWLGLDWDEETPPQSTRTAIYEAQLNLLQAKGLVYPCWCTRGTLRAVSAPHAGDGSRIYPGTCRHLSAAEKAQKTRPPALRIIVPDEVISLTDGVQGAFSENLARDCGDFPVRRADGVFVYQLAVVVDDGLSGVNEVVRGADLLGSTPRQIYLQRLLGFSEPKYYHVPLLVAPGGRRLSKRDQDLDLGVLREKCTAEALIGRIAKLVGLTDSDEPISAKELASTFDWTRVQKGPIAVSFD